MRGHARFGFETGVQTAQWKPGFCSVAHHKITHSLKSARGTVAPKVGVVRLRGDAALVQPSRHVPGVFLAEAVAEEQVVQGL